MGSTVHPSGSKPMGRLLKSSSTAAIADWEAVLANVVGTIPKRIKRAKKSDKILFFSFILISPRQSLVWKGYVNKFIISYQNRKVNRKAKIHHQGLCPYGAIFLRAPTVSELPSALLGMRTLFLGFASKATLALLLMVHQKRRRCARISFFFGGPSRTRTLDRPVMSRWL